MAETAHKTESEKKEYFDSREELDLKVSALAEMIKNSKHFIAFTGAGISTSAGVPDYRSGINTVLKTGPGAWEKKAQGVKETVKYEKTSMLKAIPTSTHMAFVALEQAGYLKFLISQNVDGLHRRSGIPPAKLSEVHGNTNLEFCKKCGKQYMRDFRTRNAQKVHDHATSRVCDDPKCKSPLYDSIINFGENLPERELKEGFGNAEKADLCLAMGSSLRVTPAADMPARVGERKKDLVIVNLQKTPLDDLCSLRIFAMCDDVMVLLMKKLNIAIPEFTLKRRLGIRRVQNKDGNASLAFRGLDIDNSPYSLFKGVNVTFGKTEIALKKEPFVFNPEKPNKLKEGKITLLLQPLGHYCEPDCSISFDLTNLGERELVLPLEYKFSLKKWVTDL